jgi:hypothetical protein
LTPSRAPGGHHSSPQRLLHQKRTFRYPPVGLLRAQRRKCASPWSLSALVTNPNHHELARRGQVREHKRPNCLLAASRKIERSCLELTVSLVLVVRFSPKKCPFGAENAHFHRVFSKCTRNIRLAGGGSSQLRTSLVAAFPANREKYRVNARNRASWHPN